MINRNREVSFKGVHWNKVGGKLTKTMTVTWTFLKQMLTTEG